MSADDNIGSWQENRKLVISELQRCSSNIHGLRGDIQAMGLKQAADALAIRTDIASLKTKAQLWGGVMGVIGGALSILAAELIIKVVFGHG